MRKRLECAEHPQDARDGETDNGRRGKRKAAENKNPHSRILRRLRPAVPPGTVYFALPQRMPILTIQLYRLKAEYWVGAQSWVGARSMPLGAASVGAAAPRFLRNSYGGGILFLIPRLWPGASCHKKSPRITNVSLNRLSTPTSQT